MWSVSRSMLGITLFALSLANTLLGERAQAQNEPPSADGSQTATEPLLKHRVSVRRDDLAGINRMVVTSDNAFLYAAPWRGDSIVAFKLGRSGTPDHVQSYSNPLLRGVIKLSLSPDEERLAGICLRSNTILLFRRDVRNGKLTPDGFSRSNLTWPVSVTFSPDGTHLYVADAGRSGASDEAPSAIVAYRVSEGGGLEEIDRVVHDDLQGTRDVLFDRQGRICYACCSNAGCVLVFERDGDSGKLKHLQTIRDDASDATLLDGVHSGVLGPDGSRIYFVAGRFRGQSGVSVFNRNQDGTLAFSHQLVLNPDQFSGGNHLAVTPDEAHVFVSGTTGDSLAVIRQDISTASAKVLSYIPNQVDIVLDGPSGLTFDAEYKYLYVAAEDGSSLTMFDIVR